MGSAIITAEQAIAEGWFTPNRNGGLCEHPGCGRPAPIARQSMRNKRIVRGEPKHFCRDHCGHHRTPRYDGVRGPIRPMKDGYLVQHVPEGDPMRSMGSTGARTRGEVPHHRLVFADALGFPLDRSWRVHHINHRPDDNRLENLMLFETNGDHTAYEESPRGRLESALAALSDDFSPLARLELEAEIDKHPVPAGCICGADLLIEAALS